MAVVKVDAGTRLEVTYELHLAAKPIDPRLIAMHHGICHTREPFQALVRELNSRGLHVVTIDQQSAHLKWFPNLIGLSSYRKGMKAALEQIEKEKIEQKGDDKEGEKKDECYKVMGYVCHSMGALICEETQQAFPHLRHPTVFMTPIPIKGAWPITWRILTRRTKSFIWACITRSVHSLVDNEEEVRTWFFDKNTPQQFVTDTTKQLTHSPFGSYFELIIRPWWRPKIDNDHGAKLLIYNTTDEIFDESEYADIKSRYPQVILKEIPGGHDFFIEYAARAADEIEAFFAEVAGPPPEPPAEPTDVTPPSNLPTSGPDGSKLRWDAGEPNIQPPVIDRTQEERDRAKENEGESGEAMR